MPVAFALPPGMPLLDVVGPFVAAKQLPLILGKLLGGVAAVVGCTMAVLTATRNADSAPGEGLLPPPVSSFLSGLTGCGWTGWLGCCFWFLPRVF